MCVAHCGGHCAHSPEVCACARVLNLIGNYISAWALLSVPHLASQNNHRLRLNV